MIEVFPIYAYFGTFGDLTQLAGRFERVAYLLVIFFLILAIGVMALRRFEGARIEGKLFDVMLAVVLIFAWPILLVNLKGLVDVFNTFLIRDVFGMTWDSAVGVSFQASFSHLFDVFTWNIFSKPLEILNFIGLLLLTIARNFIYLLFIVLLFFYALFGPIVLAKGILEDEMTGFILLLKETTIVLLWQTTFVVIVGLCYPRAGESNLLMPEMSGVSLAWIIALAILIFLVPQLTKKFADSVSFPLAPQGLKLGLAAVVGGVGGFIFGTSGRLAGAAVSVRAAASRGYHVATKSQKFIEKFKDSGKEFSVTPPKSPTPGESELRTERLKPVPRPSVPEIKVSREVQKLTEIRRQQKEQEVVRKEKREVVQEKEFELLPIDRKPSEREVIIEEVPVIKDVDADAREDRPSPSPATEKRKSVLARWKERLVKKPASMFEDMAKWAEINQMESHKPPMDIAKDAEKIEREDEKEREAQVQGRKQYDEGEERL